MRTRMDYCNIQAIVNKNHPYISEYYDMVYCPISIWVHPNGSYGVVMFDMYEDGYKVSTLTAYFILENNTVNYENLLFFDDYVDAFQDFANRTEAIYQDLFGNYGLN